MYRIRHIEPVIVVCLLAPTVLFGKGVVSVAIVYRWPLQVKSVADTNAAKINLLQNEEIIVFKLFQYEISYSR